MVVKVGTYTVVHLALAVRLNYIILHSILFVIFAEE